MNENAAASLTGEPYQVPSSPRAAQAKCLLDRCAAFISLERSDEQTIDTFRAGIR